MRKMKNSKGFTLMEMLIVVAIIAVLIAIAIPTFTASLNKAKVATDEANIRSGYASVMATVLTSDTEITTGTVYYLQKDGSVALPDAANIDKYECAGEPAAAVKIAGQDVAAWKKENVVKYTVTINGDKTSVKIEPEVKTPTP